MSLLASRRFLFGGTGSVLVMLLVAMALLVVMQPSTGGAQAGSTTAVNQYASKFLCGVISSPASPAQILAPGVYNTAVNIHNPNNFDVTIQKKAVVSVPESVQPPALNQGLPGQRATHILKPDASMEVDCSEIAALAASAQPPCTGAAGAVGFCKGYLVVEAAFPQTVGGQVKYFAAQLDVTDILTIKEEDGIWKDYTFSLRCTVAAGCQAIPNFRFDTPYNWPDRPVKPPCYNDQTLLCDIYDVDTLIRQRIGAIARPDIFIDVTHVNFATDSRDVTLDFEFVSPKIIRYPCWPKGTAACP
ncbi:MAG: hypothetical protein Q7T33_00105 [Dehalococcoidia bacterium]|nr:hypothetical protein [Dehalococcoidia bacterium]